MNKFKTPQNLKKTIQIFFPGNVVLPEVAMEKQTYEYFTDGKKWKL